MPYPDLMVQPMREDLTRLGFAELADASQVDAFINETTGTAMIVINSVCGCAAGMARPGVAMSLQHPRKPDRLATVFAGQDIQATAQVRSHYPELPPSSPSIIIIKEGRLADYIPRHRIEGREATDIAGDLMNLFDQIC